MAPHPAEPAAELLPIVIDLFFLEWRLSEWAPGGDLGSLRQDMGRSRDRLARFSLTYALDALIAHRSGDSEGVETALNGLPPDRAVGARHFLIDRDQAEVNALLAAHVAHYCEAVRAGAAPGTVFPQPDCPAAPLAPADYAAFEQWAGASHSVDRMATWTSQRPPPSRAALVGMLGLAAGARVADIGAGEGYFLDAFARAVGPTGRYTGLEIDPALVSHLRWFGQALGHAQVDAALSGLDRPDLAPQSYDLVFICEVVKAIVTNESAARPDGRAAALHWLGGAVDALAAGGRLVIVEHDFGDDPSGPSVALLAELLASLGLTQMELLPGFDGLNRVLIFRRPEAGP